LFLDYLIALFGTLTAFVVWYLGGDFFRWAGLRIGEPLIEAPYEDFSRGMPSRIRFLRLPVKSMFGGVKNVRVNTEVKQESGRQVDVPRHTTVGKAAPGWNSITLKNSIKN